jgi:hypothetical protein
MLETIVDDDIQQQNDESPIYNLPIYNKVTPLLLISLGLFYISVLMFRYIKWRYRQRKAKKIRLDRQKLERFWRKKRATSEATIQIPDHIYNQQEKEKQQLAFDSTATLVVSSSSSRSQFIIPFQEEEIENIESTLPYHLRHHNTIIQNHQDINNKKRRRPSKRDEWIDKVAHHSDHQRKKRRQLLWQWSVAMGYCRYNHGYQLNTMLNRLVEETSKHSDNNNS